MLPGFLVLGKDSARKVLISSLGLSYEDVMKTDVIQIAEVQGMESGLLSDPQKMPLSLGGAYGLGMVR